LYALANIITDRRKRHVARMGEMRQAYKVLIGNLKEDKPLIRTRRGWEDNVRIHFREAGWEVVARCIWLRIGTS